MIIQEIRKKILSMNELERIRLAEFIFDSLDKPDIEVEKKWIDESEKRYQSYRERRYHFNILNEMKNKYQK